MRQQVREQLTHGRIWSDRGDVSPLQGLQRALARASLSDRKAAAAEVFELLQSPDLVLRTRATAAARMVPIAPADLVRLLTDHRDLFRVEGEGLSLSPRVLEENLLEHLADERVALKLLRQRVREYPALAVDLAARDGLWLLANAEVVRRGVLGGVLRALPDRAARERMLRALGPWPDAQEILAKPWWRNMPDGEALRALIG